MVEKTVTEICPVCEVGTAHKIEKEEWFPWKEHNFLIKYDCWECENCSEQYLEASLNDPFQQAKAKYEELYGQKAT